MTKTENLLVTLMEECAELQQAVSKALRFGMDNCHPAQPEKSNEHEIMVEYYQLVAVMELLNSNNILRSFSIADEELVKASKKLNVERYQRVSKNIGCVKG